MRSQKGSARAPKVPQGSFKRDQRWPKKAPNHIGSPKMIDVDEKKLPKRSHEALRKPQERPRKPQEAPRRPQVGPKRLQGGPKEAPRSAQEDSKRPQERPK